MAGKTKKARGGQGMDLRRSKAAQITMVPDFEQLPSDELTRLRLNMQGTADQLRGCSSRFRAAVGCFGQAPDVEGARHELQQIQLLTARALGELGKAS